jgi:hypothetical protein
MVVRSNYVISIEDILETPLQERIILSKRGPNRDELKV